MRNVKTILMLSAVLMFAAAPAAADWDPGDGHKMHWPQLPDPNGWDVYASWSYGVADDWTCSRTGPVTDIHIWGSWKEDFVEQIDSFYIAIWEDRNGEPYRQKWAQLFSTDEFIERFWGTGDQGWLNPPHFGVSYNEHDHLGIYQYNFYVDAADAFVQEEGTTYWLVVKANLPPGSTKLFGWKTSMSEPYGNNAYSGLPVNPDHYWEKLSDPITGEALNMAFVITPEPGTMALLVLGGIGVLIRKRRK